MNKKAQLGKIISGFSIFIFLVVLMGIFILLSTGAAVIKHPKAKTASTYLPTENDLMLKLIKIEVNGVERKMLVFDAYALFENFKKEHENDIEIFSSSIAEEREKLEKVLKELVSEGNCLVLAKGNTPNPAGQYGIDTTDDFFIKRQNNEISSAGEGTRPQDSKNYRELLHKTDFLNNAGEKVYVEYYYGSCK